MAVDWIKIRTDLSRDPKVCVIADTLLDPNGILAGHILTNCGRVICVTRDVMRCATGGALATLWGVTRHVGKRDGDDMILPKATLSVLDDISGLPGLGAAMESVGWAKVDERGVSFPRFFSEFNVSPGAKDEDSRAKARERSRRYRAKKAEEERHAHGDVTRDVTVTPREEKSRGEITNTKTNARERVAEKIPDKKLRPLFLDWVAYRAVEDGVHDLAEHNLEFIAQDFMRASQEHGNEHVAKCVTHSKNKRCQDLHPWWSIFEPKKQDSDPSVKSSTKPRQYVN